MQTIYILNATQETVKTKALGNFFEWKPGQVKAMSEEIGKFIAMKRLDAGLVELPEAYEDPEWRDGPEGKAAIADAKQRGTQAYIAALRKLIYNNQVSLRTDLERAGIKADPASFASAGELDAMRIVAKYQKAKDDDAQKKVDEVRELMKQVGGVSK